MTTLKHALIRIYLYLLLILFFFTGGLTMFLLAPLYKAAFAPRASYRDFKPLRTWAHIYRVMWRSATDKHYRSLYPSRLTDPPMFTNDQRIMRIKDSWQGARDNCDICTNSCCNQIDCPLMGANRRCICYGSVYFGYFFCGRYPNNQGQIDLYDCPKWEVRDERQA